MNVEKFVPNKHGMQDNVCRMIQAFSISISSSSSFFAFFLSLKIAQRIQTENNDMDMYTKPVQTNVVGREDESDFNVGSIRGE